MQVELGSVQLHRRCHCYCAIHFYRMISLTLSMVMVMKDQTHLTVMILLLQLLYRVSKAFDCSWSDYSVSAITSKFGMQIGLLN